jgi:phenylalanyl-tRNA synthetase alpha subunit
MQLHQLSHDYKQVRATLTRKDEEHRKEIERLDQKLRDELSRAETLELTINQVIPSSLCFPSLAHSFSSILSRLSVNLMKLNYKRVPIETNSSH